jgi:SSS family solute:Na+ symporter
VTWLTPPEAPETLQRFYRRVRPHGPGWGPVRRSVGVVSSVGSLRRDLLNALAGCVLIYASLFGVGEILLRSVALGITLLVIAALAGFTIARNLEVEVQPYSAASNLPTS